MREGIVKSSSRDFLDCFWDLGASEADKRHQSTERLTKYLKSGKAETKHVQYTFERLVKGLRSPSCDARAGFSLALTKLLKEIESALLDDIFQLFDKHIFSFTASDHKENAALNAAKLLTIQILIDADRLSEISEGQHEIIISKLSPLFNIRACSARVYTLMSMLIPSNALRVHSKLYTGLALSMWTAARQAEEPSGEQVLFMLRLQHDPKFFARILGKQHRFEPSDKCTLKRLLASLKSTNDDTVVEIFKIAKSSPGFAKLWTKYSAPFAKPESSLSQKMQALKVACALSAELTHVEVETVFNPSFLIFLRKQLSSSTLSSHIDACTIVNKMLREFQQHRISPECEGDTVVDSNNDCRFPDPTTSASNAALLFAILSKYCPVFDATAAPKAPHIMPVLLECGYELIPHNELFLWARNLQSMFITGSEVTQTPTSLRASPLQLRLYILNALRQVTIFLLSRCIINDGRDAVQNFATENLDFLLLVGLPKSGGLAPDVTIPLESVVIASACVQFSKCISLLIRRASISLRGDPKTSAAKQSRDMLLTILEHLIKTGLKLSAKGSEDSALLPISERFQTSKRLLREQMVKEPTVKQGITSPGEWIVVMHSVTVLYLLCIHSNPVSPKEKALLTTIDDISECCKQRHLATCGDGTEMLTDEDSPEWSSVLTDTMISLSVEPWRLLREVVSATFSCLVASGEILTTPIDPNEAFSNKKYTFHNKKGLEKKQNNEETSEGEIEPSTPLQLILSIAGTGSDFARDRLLDQFDSGSEDDDKEDEDDISDDAEVSVGAAESDIEGSKENEGSDYQAFLDGNDYDSFGGSSPSNFTDAQMQEQDDILAAAFKAARASKASAKFKKQTAALLKLRSFDFLEDIILYSRDVNLFLPALHTVIQLAVSTSNKSSKGPLAATITDSGSSNAVVPQSRILSAIEHLNDRSLDANEALCLSLVNSNHSDMLSIFVKAIFGGCKNAAPSEKLIKSLRLVCEFLEFRKTTHCMQSVVEVALIDVLSEFLMKPHPSKAHRLLFTKFLTTSHEGAAVASKLLTDRLQACLAPLDEGKNKDSSQTLGVFAQSTALEVAIAITLGLSKSPHQAGEANKLHTWTTFLLKALIESFFRKSECSSWAKSQKLAQAVFSAVFECVKADGSSLNELSSPQLTSLFSFERKSVQKSARCYHSRIIQLVHSLKNKYSHINEICDSMVSSKGKLKELRKRERRQKRKTKAEEAAARNKGTAVQNTDNENNGATTIDKQRKTRPSQSVAPIGDQGSKIKRTQKMVARAKDSSEKRRKMEVD